MLTSLTVKLSRLAKQKDLAIHRMFKQSLRAMLCAASHLETWPRLSPEITRTGCFKAAAALRLIMPCANQIHKSVGSPIELLLHRILPFSLHT